MSDCLVCASDMSPFISFGKMPVANGFLMPEEYKDEFFFDLQVGLCPSCSMAQLTELVAPDKLFHENYAYFASTSASMTAHFKTFAQGVFKRLNGIDDPFVIEIGSNDGIMLQNFAQAKVRHLGIEPSENVAAEARRQSIDTTSVFFSEETAAQILAEHGPANAILGANAVSHIPDINSLLAGVNVLLAKGGIFMFEEPYLGDIIAKTAYDQFYDEHVFYFCLSSLSNALARHGLIIIDAEPQNTHGGSMRYVITRKGEGTMSATVTELRAQEESLGLSEESTFLALKARIDDSNQKLTSLLGRLKQEGKRVVGYGATSKSTTMTNYAQIGPELVEFISDTTPTKQGKFTPGMHIPVKPYQDFKANYPDYALLLAWNHGEEIIANEQDYLRQGGKFITFVPQVEIRE
jgi:methylation protein EvaC